MKTGLNEGVFILSSTWVAIPTDRATMGEDQKLLSLWFQSGGKKSIAYNSVIPRKIWTVGTASTKAQGMPFFLWRPVGLDQAHKHTYSFSK